MTMTLALAAAAFVVGFAWGFARPASYCHLSTAQRRGFANRFSSGLISGFVFGFIVALVAYIAFGAA